MRILSIVILLLLSLHGKEFKLRHWQPQETFSDYLVRHHIDATKFYAHLNPEDQKFLADIQANAPFFERSTNETLQEALIPLGEAMQMHIAKTEDGYSFDIIPMEYKTIQNHFDLNITTNCATDIKRVTNNAGIAFFLKQAFKEQIDFTKLRKGDFIAVDYEQKSIDGIPWENPIVKAALVKRGAKEYFVLQESNNSYHFWTNSQTTHKVKQHRAHYITFSKPLQKLRVTSTFTYRRWHPILKRYRPHLGVDFGAKTGTPIYAVANGKVIYAGWIRGYGRVVKIDHGHGIVSLYAHQHKILVKPGQHVQAGKVIGQVGSSGMSTGSHLHLGIYLQGRAKNPLKFLQKKVAVGNSVVTKRVVIQGTNLQKELPHSAQTIYKKLTKTVPNNHIYKWKDLDKNVTITPTKSKSASNNKQYLQG